MEDLSPMELGIYGDPTSRTLFNEVAGHSPFTIFFEHGGDCLDS
jgi:hypothetical protein